MPPSRQYEVTRTHKTLIFLHTSTNNNKSTDKAFLQRFCWKKVERFVDGVRFEGNYFLRDFSHIFPAQRTTNIKLKAFRIFADVPSFFLNWAWNLNKKYSIHFLSICSFGMLRVCQRWWRQKKWKANEFCKQKNRAENKNKSIWDYWQHNEKWLEKSIPHIKIKSFLLASEWFHQYPLIIFSFIC